jgi:hypothetical protein
MCPLLFGFSEMCGPSCAHVFFCGFLYAKGKLKQKHVTTKKYLFIIVFYAATVQSTWGLKECKSRKYFYDLFQCRYREINMLI